MMRNIQGWYRARRTDSEAGKEVVDHRKNGRLELERDPERRDHSSKRNEDDEVGVQPVDVLIPVLQCYRLVRDVCFVEFHCQ